MLQHHPRFFLPFYLPLIALNRPSIESLSLVFERPTILQFHNYNASLITRRRLDGYYPTGFMLLATCYALQSVRHEARG
jgi:hypothetical protein